MKQSTEQRKAERKRNLRNSRFWLGLAAFFALCIAVGLGYEDYIKEHIAPDIKIDGVTYGNIQTMPSEVSKSCGFWVPALTSIPDGEAVTQVRTCREHQAGAEAPVQVVYQRAAYGMKYVPRHRQ